MPDWFVTEHIRIGRFDNHRDTTQCAAALMFFNRSSLADEIWLIETDETIHTGFERPIDWTQFAEPCGEVFLKTQSKQCAHTEID